MSNHSPKGQVTNVAHFVTDPSAIGLFGLAMVTLVASSQKMGWTEGTALVMPWAIFLGAAAQVYAGSLDAKLNNIFGATAFLGYGFFWFAMGTSWLVQNGVFGEAMAATADPKQMGFAFIGYLIFTIYMTIGAMETNKVLLIIFILIDFLFLGLSLSTFGIAEHFFHQVAAIAELCIAVFSFYGSAATVLNAHYGRMILPIGKPCGVL